MTSHASKATRSSLRSYQGGGKSVARSSVSKSFDGGSPDVKPSDLHDLQLKTFRIMAQVKQKRAQLDKMRRSVLQANAIIENPGGSQLAHHGNTQKQALQQSIDSARNVLKALNRELAAGETDDRVAQYRELEEGIKAAFLEVERLTQEQANSSAYEDAEKALREADHRASRAVREAEEFMLEKLRKERAALIGKVAAYRDRWYKMEAEDAIHDSRSRKRAMSKVRTELSADAKDLDAENQALVDELNQKAAEHDRRVAYLRTLVDSQRKKVLDHLAGS